MIPLGTEESSKYYRHEDVSDGRGEGCTHCCPCHLVEYVSGELKIVIVDVDV